MMLTLCNDPHTRLSPLCITSGKNILAAGAAETLIGSRPLGRTTPKSVNIMHTLNP